MPRLPELPLDSLSPEHKAVADAIMGGKRAGQRSQLNFLTPSGALIGPYNAFVHGKGVGNAAQALGAALRFEGRLTEQQKEVAILTVGVRWQAQFEFWAHLRLGRKAGLDETAMEAIRTGGTPAFDDPVLGHIHQFAKEQAADGHVSDATYQVVLAALDHERMVELTLLCGYYSMISMLLNVFEIPIPEGETPPFDR